MTQEDKELLLKDFSARLPYYPKCEMIDELRVVNNEKDSSYISTLFPKHIELFSYHNNFTIKPYLRSMSSMTEEEKKEVSILLNYEFYIDDDYALAAEDDRHRIRLDLMQVYIDWLNAHHFDYHELIERGLAIEVTEDNNPYKE